MHGKIRGRGVTVKETHDTFHDYNVSFSGCFEKEGITIIFPDHPQI
jgi:hypothetical protein